MEKCGISMILDSFDLMPSDCVLTDYKDKHHCENPICAIFLYFINVFKQDKNNG
jgi:hypothetical protein